MLFSFLLSFRVSLFKITAIVFIVVTLLSSNTDSVDFDNELVSAIVSLRPVLSHYKGTHAALTMAIQTYELSSSS